MLIKSSGSDWLLLSPPDHSHKSAWELLEIWIERAKRIGKVKEINWKGNPQPQISVLPRVPLFLSW
jgi:hypothetical protein